MEKLDIEEKGQKEKEIPILLITDIGRDIDDTIALLALIAL